MTRPAVQTCLWFESGAEEAARFYAGLLPDTRIVHVFPQRGDPLGRTLLVHLDLMGQRFSLLNGGPHFRLNPSASIEVHLETQAEVDRLWDALLEGGTAMQCGWLTDRWGVSWQIIPRVLIELLKTDDDVVAGRVLQAMMAMMKLDGPALEAAARG